MNLVELVNEYYRELVECKKKNKRLLEKIDELRKHLKEKEDECSSLSDKIDNLLEVFDILFGSDDIL